MVLAVQFLFSAQEFFQDHSYEMGRPITMRFLFLTQSLIHHTIAAQSIPPGPEDRRDRSVAAARAKTGGPPKWIPSGLN